MTVFDKRLIARGFLLIMLLLSTAACRAKEVVGTRALDFSLSDIKGVQINYSEVKGKPTILYFFASW